MVVINEVDCSLDMVYFESFLLSKIKFVVVMYVLNIIGLINDIKCIVEFVYVVGVLVYVDVVYYVFYELVDVQVFDCDFLVCFVYKFFGFYFGIVYGKCEYFEGFILYKVEFVKDVVLGCWEIGM